MELCVRERWRGTSMVAERGRREISCWSSINFLKKKKLWDPVPQICPIPKRMFHITQPRNANRRKIATNSTSECSNCERHKGENKDRTCIYFWSLTNQKQKGRPFFEEKTIVIFSFLTIECKIKRVIWPFSQKKKEIINPSKSSNACKPHHQK